MLTLTERDMMTSLDPHHQAVAQDLPVRLSRDSVGEGGRQTLIE